MIALVKYHTGDAVRVSLVKRGIKWMKVVAIDASASGGLKVWRVPVSDEKYMSPLVFANGKPYAMARALKSFRMMAKSHGCSKAAMKLIKEAAHEDKTAKKDAASTGGDA